MPELRLEHSIVDGRFEVSERLGLGSYAEIFVARDYADSGREVVIKALNTSLQGTPDADMERTLVENFQNEAVALDAVRHPHVILRLGHGTAADLRKVPFHYLVLEYMPGGDLLQLCRSCPTSSLKLPEALFFFRQACEALAYAHGQGIIHRDLKPNNLLLSGDHLTLKVADFGVAKLTTGDHTEITRVGAGIYAPPEHHPDEPVDDHRSNIGRLTAAADIYSLAKSFYTVICGRAPSQFVRRPISSLASSVSQEPWADALLVVLRRATADEVDARHGSVVEFWTDLANVAAGAVGETDQEVETRVRPRLRVAPGELPSSPAQPAFSPVLASAGVVTFTTRGGGRTPPPVSTDSLRSPKIVVPIARPAPAPPATQTQPGKPVERESTRARPARWLWVRDVFTATLRRRLFLVLLAIAFLGLLASVYHYTRVMAPPTAIDVMTVNLNVRSGPSYQYAVLGTVSKGTRHRVLGHSDNGWLRIEVSQWNEALPHDELQRQGWVNGSDEYVTIVERRWW